jgi:hypothetical protein
MSEKRSTSSASLEEKGDHIEVLEVPFVKSEAEKRLVRKMNLRLLPIAGFIIFLQVRLFKPLQSRKLISYILVCR